MMVESSSSGENSVTSPPPPVKKVLQELKMPRDVDPHIAEKITELVNKHHIRLNLKLFLKELDDKNKREMWYGMNEEAQASLLKQYRQSIVHESDSTSSQRPRGVMKAKMKRKIDDYLKMVQSENSRIIEMMNDSTERKKEALKAKREALRLKELKEENKILLIDVDSIVDPNRREFWRQEQKRIVDKRSQ